MQGVQGVAGTYTVVALASGADMGKQGLRMEKAQSTWFPRAVSCFMQARDQH